MIAMTVSAFARFTLLQGSNLLNLSRKDDGFKVEAPISPFPRSLLMLQKG